MVKRRDRTKRVKKPVRKTETDKCRMEKGIGSSLKFKTRKG